VPPGHVKLTGYEVGYNGPKPYTLPCQICQPKIRRQSPLCPICQHQRRKGRRQSSRVLKGRETNYLCGGRQRNPNNVSAMPMLLTLSFTPICINLNTNVCLFIHNNGTSTHGSLYTHVFDTPFTMNKRLPTLLHYLNWTLTRNNHLWTRKPTNLPLPM